MSIQISLQAYVNAESTNANIFMYTYTFIAIDICIQYEYIYIYQYTINICEGCSKFFHVENAIFARKKFFRQTLANPTFIFSRTCWPRLVRRTWMCDILKFAPGVWSLVTLHSVAAALNIYVLLEDVGPCSPSSASSDTTSPQFGPPT